MPDGLSAQAEDVMDSGLFAANLDPKRERAVPGGIRPQTRLMLFFWMLTMKVPLQSPGLGLKAMGLASLGRKCNRHHAGFETISAHRQGAAATLQRPLPCEEREGISLYVKGAFTLAAP